MLLRALVPTKLPKTSLNFNPQYMAKEMAGFFTFYPLKNCNMSLVTFLFLCEGEHHPDRLGINDHLSENAWVQGENA